MFFCYNTFFLIENMLFHMQIRDLLSINERIKITEKHQDVLETSHVRSIYIMCSEGNITTYVNLCKYYLGVYISMLLKTLAKIVCYFPVL